MVKPKKKKRRDNFESFQVVATNEFMNAISTFHQNLPSLILEALGTLLNSFCEHVRKADLKKINFGALTYNVYGLIQSVSLPYFEHDRATVNNFIDMMVKQGNVHIYHKEFKLVVVVDVNINPNVPAHTFALCSHLTEFDQSTIH